MSWNPALEPDCLKSDVIDAIETVIVPRARDLGGFEVRRALPTRGMDVRPHPHIGLATISYLYRGRMHHRDSLGTDSWIEPGAVNWMVAGYRITRSEGADDAKQVEPMPDNHKDRRVCVVNGAVNVAGQTFDAGQMMVFPPGDRASVSAGASGARLMILGGATMEGQRHIWWNFVASSKERLEEAKELCRR